MCVLSLIFHCFTAAKGGQSVKGRVMKILLHFDKALDIIHAKTRNIHFLVVKTEKNMKPVPLYAHRKKWGPFHTFLRCYSFAFVFHHILRRWLPRSQVFAFSLVPEIQTFYMTRHSSACSMAACNPREMTISVTFVCSEPPCMRKTEFCTQVPALLYINLHSEWDPKLVTFSYSSSQWSIYVGRLRFLIHHPNPLPIPFYSRLGLCQRERNEQDKTKVWVLMMFKKVELHSRSLLLSLFPSSTSSPGLEWKSLI